MPSNSAAAGILPCVRCNASLIRRCSQIETLSVSKSMPSEDGSDWASFDSFCDGLLWSRSGAACIPPTSLSKDSKEAVPDFVSHALDNISQLAKRSGTDRIFGISIEPARLNIGFGKTGLINEIHRLQGSVIANAEIAGDRAGKSVTTFKF